MGTAQFGMNYGVSNVDGRTPPPVVGEMLRLAAAHRVDLLDTAWGYGDSEEVLGAALPPGHGFRIVTKTPARENGGTGPAEALRESLDRLRAGSVYGLLAHLADDLLAKDGNRLYETMLGLKEKGLVRKIGAAVYTGRQIDELTSRYRLDIVQVPLNLFDQRLLRGGHLRRLKQAGVEVIARSAFLQGLLLMPSERIPPYFAPWQRQLGEFHEAAARRGATPLHAALSFCLGQPDVDVVICGANTLRQWEEILAAASSPLALDGGTERFALEDEKILNPALWPREARA